MKKLSIVFGLLAVLLSDIMCAVVAYNYAYMLWGIKYEGYGAPASTSFVLAVPFLIGIVVAVVLAFVFWKKSVK